MTCTTNITASTWFYYQPEYLSVLIANSCWPWTQIDPSDWLKISSANLANVFNCAAFSQLFVLIISPIGIISSICSALSLWRKATVEKERFYVYMLIIALFDLIYCLLDIPTALSWGSVFPNIYRYSYFWSAAARIFGAGVVSASLAADLCTLMLSYERFLAICKPNSFANKNIKLAITAFSIFVVIILCFMRFFLSATMFKAAEAAPDATGRITYMYVSTEISLTTWFTYLQQANKSILPLLLLLAMTYLSLRIAYVIVKRRKSRINQSASVQQQQAVQEQSTAMLRLLAILVSLYVLNQLGWCVRALEAYIDRDVTVGYNSSMKDVQYYVNLKLFAWICSLFATISECSARSLNFYLYCICTESTRDEFRRVLGFGPKQAVGPGMNKSSTR